MLYKLGGLDQQFAHNVLCGFFSKYDLKWQQQVLLVDVIIMYLIQSNLTILDAK